MCNLCGNKEEREKAKRYMKFQADSLRELAGLLDGVANGSIDPHSDRAKDISARAHHLIRYLVEDWM